VRPVENTIVVNFGDMLSRITCGQLKSTKHRVRDIGVERYSSPFFLEPYYDAKIPASIVEASEQSNEHFVYGTWVTEKMREFGEFKNLFQKA